MKHLAITVTASILMLVLLSGCPAAPEAADVPPDTELAVENNVCETLPPADTAARADIPPPEPAPKPRPKPRPKAEPEPEPVPEPKALPRMWDFGSEKCIPCKEMERILTPMMSEYADRVDIRIINIYEEKQMSAAARIQIIPTQVFYDPSGTELFRHVGAYPRDSIVAKFREFGWE